MSCERCKAWEAEKRGRCHACGIPMPEYPGMGGSGFESRTIDHYHEEQVGRHVMAVPVMRSLCLTCYRRDQVACGEAPLVDPPFTLLK